MFSRQDGVGTVTQEEKESFGHVKERLRILLERHLTNFRFVFPFGRPEGALKSTISLLERVSYKKVIHFLGTKVHIVYLFILKALLTRLKGFSP